MQALRLTARRMGALVLAPALLATACNDGLDGSGDRHVVDTGATKLQGSLFSTENEASLDIAAELGMKHLFENESVYLAGVDGRPLGDGAAYHTGETLALANALSTSRCLKLNGIGRGNSCRTSNVGLVRKCISCLASSLRVTYKALWRDVGPWALVLLTAASSSP